MTAQKKAPKLPKAFRKAMDKKKWDKKVMGKIFLPEDREFLDSVKKESEDKIYIEIAGMDKKQIKRLKGLSKIIIANRKGMSFPLLIIGLIGISGLLLWQFLLKDRILTHLAEVQLEKVFQAEVEVKDLDASLFRASLSVTDLVIADKNKPMQNLIELKDLEATLDPHQLLRGRVHILEMGFRDLERGTEREVPGTIESAAEEDEILIDQPEESNVIDRISASLGQIDPVDILDKEMSNLQSPTLIEETQRTYERYQEQWNEEIQSWDGKVEQWEDSTQFIISINPGSFDSLEEARTTLERLNRIGNDARTDIRKAQESIDEVQEEWNQAQNLYRKVEEALRSDYQYLEGLVSMSGGEKLNWVAGILDDQMGSSITKYLSYWEKGRQWLAKLQNSSSEKDQDPEKDEGRRLPMGPDTPPLFLLQHAYASGQEGESTYNVEIFNLSNAPERWDNPLNVQVNWDSPETGPVEALIDETHATMNVSSISFNLQEALEPLGISSVSGSASLQADLQRTDEILTGTLLLTIPEFRTVRTREDSLSRAITGTLDSTKDTVITNRITLSEGTLSMQIESELDNLLNRAMGNLLKEVGEESARLLREAFAEQTEGPLKELDQRLGALGMEMENLKDLESSLNTLEELSAEKKKEIEEHLAQQLENQASDLLNNLPGGFF